MSNNKTTTMEYSLTDPIYTAGLCGSSSSAIKKIEKIFKEYGEGKYVNFVGLPINELDEVQAAFPDHTIINSGSDVITYCEVRPRSKVSELIL